MLCSAVAFWASLISEISSWGPFPARSSKKSRLQGRGRIFSSSLIVQVVAFRLVFGTVLIEGALLHCVDLPGITCEHALQTFQRCNHFDHYLPAVICIQNEPPKNPLGEAMSSRDGQNPGISKSGLQYSAKSRSWTMKAFGIRIFTTEAPAPRR